MANPLLLRAQARIQELEEELEAERSMRSKSEKTRQQLEAEIEDMADRLDEAGGATSAQVEVNRKREQELAKVRRDLEESHLQHEQAMSQLKKRHQDAVNELADQNDQLQKAKAK